RDGTRSSASPRSGGGSIRPRHAGTRGSRKRDPVRGRRRDRRAASHGSGAASHLRSHTTGRIHVYSTVENANERSVPSVTMTRPKSETRSVWDVYESPLGPLTIHAGSRGVSWISFPGQGRPLDESARDSTALAPVVSQLEEYFAGDRRAFDIPL